MIDKNLDAFLKEKARRIRVHCVRSTALAGSGHPTTCLSAADLVAALFFHVMRYDPHNYANPQNDRFVLSKGHGAPVLYAAWAEAGALRVEDLDTLRRIDSDLEGHPTPRFFGADVATGSLGQGLSNAVGMALNGKYLDKSAYRVYALMGDGETAEGSIWEAAALAAYYKLDNLVGIVDVNGLGQSQRTMYGSDIESYERRFSAFGWYSIGIDGHNMGEIVSAFEKAKTIKGQPVLIAARTVKGKGVSFIEGKEGWHGRPLKKGEELERALKELEAQKGREDVPEVKVQSPAKSEAPVAPVRVELSPPSYKIGDMVATREAYGAALVKLGAADGRVVALDGDTKNSTYSEKFLQAYPDRFFECFIAEQNMVGVAVGLASRGKIPFASTFGVFLTRAFDQIRMGAISRANIKLVGTHAGISIGEDGPSQMGLEDLAMMRAVPGALVLYPSDAVAAERLITLAATHRGMAYLRLARPKTAVLYASDEEFKIGGCKVLRSSPSDRVTVVAAGVTVYEALKAYDALKKDGISVRVIDAYSVKPIAREDLLKAASETNNTIITVEDHYYEGGLGDAVLSAVGDHGLRVFKLAVREVPRSGKPEELLQAYGISSAHIVDKVKEVTRK
jgi:transketolase